MESARAPWGKEQEAELAQVVVWAKERITWELLQYQLQVPLLLVNLPTKASFLVGAVYHF